MSTEKEKGNWFWITLLLSCLTILLSIFLIWELLERRFFQDLDLWTLHSLYITRGIVSSLLLAAWAVWFVLRERRKAEEGLRRSGERYRAMLVHAADAIALFDRSLTVLEWNPQAAYLYGYTREEVLDRRLPTVNPAEEEKLQSALERLARGEPAVELETRRRHRSGENVDVGVRLSSFPDVATGQLVFLEMASDLREQIRLRQKALEMEKLTGMGRMAAGTAHSLNTPLAAMLLRIEMLRDRISDERWRDELGRLESSTRFCQDFVQKLLQYSRRSEPTFSCVDVGELVDSIGTFFRPSFAVRHHTLCWDNRLLQGHYILADRNQMEALFAALLMNSLDALSPGGTVCVEGAVRDGEVVLRVRDDGCGVPEDKLSYIFEPFFTTKESGLGTGLGLSIARNIVEEHGGKIHLGNNSSLGVTVQVRLPLCGGREISPRCADVACPVKSP